LIPQPEFDPYWLDEKDWTCIGVFLSKDDEEERAMGAETIAYFFACAQATGTRMLALVGDPANDEYELLFSFRSPEMRQEFFELAHLHEPTNYNDCSFLTPGAESIRAARPLALVLPEGVWKEVELTVLAFLHATASHWAN